MAVGSLLQTYLSRFGVSMEGMSGETIGYQYDALKRLTETTQPCGTDWRAHAPLATLASRIR